MVFVRKENNRWCMCVNFTNMNVTCLKDLYPLPNIDQLFNGSLGYCMLSFIDAYSGYNQIQMDPLDASKTSFMSNDDNYYYNVIPLNLKNVDAIYQQLVDVVFS